MRGGRKARVAIVTGGLSGIGHAVAMELARSGHRVSVGARDVTSVPRQAALAVLAQAADAHGGAMDAGVLDLRDDASVAAFVKRTEDRFGAADILVNAAGITAEHPVTGHPDALWTDVIDTNLTGAFRMIRATLPSMMARGWGRIINIGSTAASVGAADNPAYCASKAGLLGLTRCVALEGAASGVSCVMVSPTWVDTPMMDADLAQIVAREGRGRSIAEARAAIAAENPQRRIIQPAEVAAVVGFLAGDAVPGLTMEDIRITGGALW